MRMLMTRFQVNANIVEKLAIHVLGIMVALNAKTSTQLILAGPTVSILKTNTAP